jgi:hypothetical protein
MIKTLREAKRLSKERGLHWFSPETVEFFGTKVYEDTFTPGEGVTYFISSEISSPHTEPTERRYTVRSIDWKTARVKTIGSYLGHATYEDALTLMRSLKT